MLELFCLLPSRVVCPLLCNTLLAYFVVPRLPLTLKSLQCRMVLISKCNLSLADVVDLNGVCFLFVSFPCSHFLPSVSFSPRTRVPMPMG